MAADESSRQLTPETSPLSRDCSALFVTLDRGAVAAPAQRVATLASHAVGTFLPALPDDDLSPAHVQADSMTYSLGALNMSPEERRQTFQNWILSKGFQDLARGVRETLEEAFLYIDIHKLKATRMTLAQLQERAREIRTAAARKNFPKLLKQVNKDLSEPMAFEDEFLSLQRVRNCLEHRGGLVGPGDVDGEKGTMTLSFPRLRVYYSDGDKEVELGVGQTMRNETSVYVRLVTRLREYKLGEPVIISASDFAEVAMACHLFAQDLSLRLPGETR